MSCGCGGKCGGGGSVLDRIAPVKPRVLFLGDYHSIEDRGSYVDRFEGQQFAAVSIGPRSGVDAAVVNFGDGDVALSRESWLLADIRDALEVKEFYPAVADDIDDRAQYVTPLELLMWPSVPALIPTQRGPIRKAGFVTNTGNAEALVGLIPTYGRSRIRIQMHAATNGASVIIRARSVLDSQTVRDYALWPTEGDETDYTDIAAGDTEFVTSVEGHDYHGVFAKSTTTDQASVLTVWWEVFD